MGLSIRFTLFFLAAASIAEPIFKDPRYSPEFLELLSSSEPGIEDFLHNQIGEDKEILENQLEGSSEGLTEARVDKADIKQVEFQYKFEQICSLNRMCDDGWHCCSPHTCCPNNAQCCFDGKCCRIKVEEYVQPRRALEVFLPY